MTKPAPIDPSELRRIAEAATGGPWTAERLERDLEWWVTSKEVGAMFNTGYVGNSDAMPNAAHIAAFDPPTALHLIDTVEYERAGFNAATQDRNQWRDRTTTAEATIARIRELHKPERLWEPYEGAGHAFRTEKEAYAALHDTDVSQFVLEGIGENGLPHFDICVECGRMESSQLEEIGEEWGYRESHYPCPSIQALDGGAS